MAIVINGSGTVTGLAVGGLPDGTVDAGTLADDAVVEAKIGANAVVTAAINDDAVTNAKVAANAIEEAQLAANAVVTGKIEDGTIAAGDLASGVGGKLVKSTLAYNNSTRQVFSLSVGLQISSENFRTPSGGYHYFTCTKSSSSSTLVLNFSLSIGSVQNNHVFAVWRTSGSGSSTTGVANFTRLAFDSMRNMGTGTATSEVMGGIVAMTGLSTGTHHFWFSFGRSNDGSSTKYTLNPDTNEGSDKSGSTKSTIIINEIEM